MPNAQTVTPAPAVVEALWQARSDWQQARRTRLLLQAEALRDCQVRAVRVDFDRPPGPGARVLVCVGEPGRGLRRAAAEQPAAGAAFVRAGQGAAVTRRPRRVVDWHEIRHADSDYWLWAGTRRGLTLAAGEALLVVAEDAPAGVRARATVSGV
jgi:hypothetical protein